MPSLRKTQRYNKNKRRLKNSSNKSRKMRGGFCGKYKKELQDVNEALDSVSVRNYKLEREQTKEYIDLKREYDTLKHKYDALNHDSDAPISSHKSPGYMAIGDDIGDDLDHHTGNTLNT